MFFDSLFHPNHDSSASPDHVAPDHLHTTHDSHAVDSDGDGFSDAVENLFGTDPFSVGDHPHLTSFDSDGDGFSDSVEHLFGTDPLSGLSHPDLVMAHHAHIDPDLAVNFAGRLDVPMDCVTAGSDGLSLFEILYNEAG